jgi:hypothetical protein
MPESAAAPAHPGRLTSDSARKLASRRWQRDNQGLDACIDRLERRQDALTGEQRQRLDAIAASLPAFGQAEIEAAGRAAARIDARLGGDHAT